MVLLHPPKTSSFARICSVNATGSVGHLAVRQRCRSKGGRCNRVSRPFLEHPGLLVLILLALDKILTFPLPARHLIPITPAEPWTNQDRSLAPWACETLP